MHEQELNPSTDKASTVDWEAIDKLIDQALLLPPTQQAPFLRQHIANDSIAKKAIARLQAESFSTQFLMTAGWQSSDTKPLPHGTQIDAWEIDSALGAGGMGEVYKVHRADGLYEQTAAMKLVSFDDEDARQLFELERRTQAKLEHPNIARMIDGGIADDGRHYLVTEFIEGDTIDQFVCQRALTERQILKLLLGVCSGLTHAHSRLVLHRDIKPSNVIVLNSGQVKIIDFGIALNLANLEQHTVLAPHTKQTAAPEQLNGDEVSVTTDIFALGVMLHILLTGHPPKRNQNGGVDIALAHGAPADLLAILTKATAVAVNLRYASVEALASDIKCYLDGYPISARPLTASYQLAKFYRRHTLGMLMGGAFLISLVAGLGFSLYFAEQANAEAIKANKALQQTERALTEAEHSARFEQATNQAFQALFSASGAQESSQQVDEAVLKEGLIAYANKQLEQIADKPEAAGYGLAAIGSIFIMRNDYPSAIKVLQPWASNQQAPIRIQAIRDALLGRALLQTGKTQDALPLLKRSIDMELARDSDYAGSPSHASGVSTYAVASNRDADRREALQVLALAIERDKQNTDGFYHPYFYNEIGVHKRQLGDIKGAVEALQMGINSQLAIDPNRVINTDNTYVNLATLQLYALDDLSGAAQSLAEVERIANELKGESWILARGLFVRAELFLRAGNFTAAQAALTRSDELANEFLGDSRPDVIQYIFKSMRISLAMGDEAQALQYFNQFSTSLLTTVSSDITDLETALGAAFFAQYNGDNDRLQLLIDRVKALLGDKSPSLRQAYLLRRLQAD